MFVSGVDLALVRHFFSRRDEEGVFCQHFFRRAVGQAGGWRREETGEERRRQERREDTGESREERRGKDTGERRQSVGERRRRQ